MNRNSFTSKSPGRLVKNLDGNWAFVPAPLPPRITWTDSLVLAVTRANQKLGELAGLGKKLRNPKRMVRMFLRREAELSSKIENTHARVQTMLLFEQIPAVERDTPSVREVHNNFLTLEFALESAQQRGLTRSLIKEMHENLLRGVRGAEKMPGSFRTTQAHIGRTQDIEKARFVPCPSHEIESCMQQLERYLQKVDEIPPVVRAALVHYQFEAIHPFADGNGRVGRVLLLVQLMKEGVLPAPLLNPSAQLEHRRDVYYDRLLGVSQKGQWAQWAEFFATSIAEEANDAIARIERFELLREQYQQLVRRPRSSALLPQLVDELFSEPSVTIRRVADLFQITPRAALKLLDRLVDTQIVREVTGQARNRVYLAQGVVDLFSAAAIRPQKMPES